MSAIQRTALGVAGFNPQAAIAVDFNQGAGQVLAQVAPPHDSFLDNRSGMQVHTRAVKFSFGSEFGRNNESTIEMFGLNLYVPDPSLDGPFEENDSQPASSSGLILVGNSGRATTREQSFVAGEIPIIAVRNTETGDAKVYLFLEQDDEASIMPDSQRELERGVPIVTGFDSTYRLPDGQDQRIRILSGAELQQAAAEFADATTALKTGGIHQLSLAEQAAVASTQNRADSDPFGPGSW